jgi:hypothetical protein
VTSSRICARSPASSDENGSSRTTRCGRGASARASATRCCWPPDSWCGRDRCSPGSPTSSSSSATRSYDSRPRGSPNATLCATSRCGEQRSLLRHHADAAPLGRDLARPLPATFLPSSTTSSRIGVVEPATIRSRVVLPPPEGPRTRVMVPSARRDPPRRARRWRRTPCARRSRRAPARSAAVGPRHRRRSPVSRVARGRRARR